MSDIRARLNVRRDDLLARVPRDEMFVEGGAHVGSQSYDIASRNLGELRAIEATLATMQLADAQMGVAAAQREIAAAQRAANDQADTARSVKEEESFWSRRYLTTLAVANAGGLFAFLAFLTRADAPLVPWWMVTSAFGAFLLGSVYGGTYPLQRLLLLKPRAHGKVVRLAVTFWVPFAMTVCFALALCVVTAGAFTVYDARLDTLATEAAKTTNG